jgi:hypothetical protein
MENFISLSSCTPEAKCHQASLHRFPKQFWLLKFSSLFCFEPMPVDGSSPLPTADNIRVECELTSLLTCLQQSLATILTLGIPRTLIWILALHCHEICPPTGAPMGDNLLHKCNFFQQQVDFGGLDVAVLLMG